MRGILADSQRECCTWDRREGWIYMCPTHVEANAALSAALPAIEAAADAGHINTVKAALAAVGVGRISDLPTDADRVGRFLDALDLLS